MKYAVNHDWKFRNYQVAWLCGFMQAFNVVVVELVNFAALLTNSTILDIIMNFLALVVIADFDEYFYSAIKNDELADIVTAESPYENFLIIQRTTSKGAKWLENIDGTPMNRLEPQECEVDFVDEEDAKEAE